MKSINDRFKEAIALRNERNFQGAEEMLNEILDLYPEHPSIPGVYIILGGIYFDQQYYIKAHSSFKIASIEKPKSERASLGLYLSSIELKEYDDAIKELNRFLLDNKPKLYKTTLLELLGDLEFGYATDHKDAILLLAKKYGIELGQG